MCYWRYYSATKTSCYLKTLRVLWYRCLDRIGNNLGVLWLHVWISKQLFLVRGLVDLGLVFLRLICLLLYRLGLLVVAKMPWCSCYYRVASLVIYLSWIDYDRIFFKVEDVLLLPFFRLAWSYLRDRLPYVSTQGWSYPLEETWSYVMHGLCMS